MLSCIALSWGWTITGTVECIPTQGGNAPKNLSSSIHKVEDWYSSTWKDFCMADQRAHISMVMLWRTRPSANNSTLLRDLLKLFIVQMSYFNSGPPSYFDQEGRPVYLNRPEPYISTYGDQESGRTSFQLGASFAGEDIVGPPIPPSGPSYRSSWNMDTNSHVLTVFTASR